MIQGGKVGMRSDGDYDYEMFWLRCDNCGELFGRDNDITSFDEIVKLKKQLGFKSFKKDGKWYEFCPNCRTQVESEE